MFAHLLHPTKATTSWFLLRLLQWKGILLLSVLVLGGAPSIAAELTVPVAYVSLSRSPQSNTLTQFQTPSDNGIAGAKLGIADSNTTGKFLGNHYALTVIQHANTEALLQAVEQWRNQYHGAVIADVPDQVLSKLIAQPGADLIINISNPSDKWRQSQCQQGLLHTAPSYAMLADALGQFLMAKRWREWLLVVGEDEQDKAFEASIKRAAKRFGMKITGHKTWTFDTDLRRTSQQEVPALTQGDDYDVVLVADTQNTFGFYLPYNTWLPRPVAGTHGLTATAWHQSIEQWGAVQLQNRFFEAAARPMNADDYNGWLAVRAIAEAVTRTQRAEAAALYEYLMSDGFELAAFKGRKLTFRQWNGQLRQPVPLVQPQSLVSQSPQQGFLHPTTDLDTLGFDQPEVSCRMNKE